MTLCGLTRAWLPHRGSPTGWFDFVSCSLEASATPLLDIQSDHNITGGWQGLDQVIIRDYMAADWLQPHFGAGKIPVVAIVRACAFARLPLLQLGASDLFVLLRTVRSAARGRPTEAATSTA